MNKRSICLALAVCVLMIAALAGLPMLTGGIAREEMREPVVETCTPMPTFEIDEYGNYLG